MSGIAGRSAGVVALAAGLFACGTLPGAEPRLHTHEGLHATLWLQTAAEYHATTLQAYHAAIGQLDHALEDRTWSAAHEQGGDYASLPPAVVLDMDEAIVRSDRYQASLVAHDRGFDLDDWNAWIRTEEAEPVAGALEYARHAMNRGIHVFYVTNRTYEVETGTVATLRKLGFPVDAEGLDVLSRDERPAWGLDKSSRRAHLAATHRILQIVGDNLNDFIGGSHSDPGGRRALVERYRSWWGTRWIITPNPAYGSWERALYGFERGLSREEKLRRKYERLRPWN